MTVALELPARNVAVPESTGWKSEPPVAVPFAVDQPTVVSAVTAAVRDSVIVAVVVPPFPSVTLASPTRSSGGCTVPANADSSVRIR